MTNPETPRVEFRPGDRVRMTSLAYREHIYGRLPVPVTGTVCPIRSRDNSCIHVLVDGKKYSKRYHVDFWEHIPT